MENNHLESLPQTPKEPENNGWESVAALADSFNTGAEDNQPRPEDYTESDNHAETETQSEAKENHETEDRPETLADRIKNTAKLVEEIKYFDGPRGYYEIENLMIDFGLDKLSERYGLENTLTVISQETGKMHQPEQPSGSKWAWKREKDTVSEAIKNIYSRLEPDADKRRALYAEITNGENNEARRAGGTIYLDKNGDVRIYRTGKGSAKSNEKIAEDGLLALNELVEHVNNPDSLIFGESAEQAKAEGKAPIGKMVDGLENPSIKDLLGRAEKFRNESAKIAETQISAESAEAEAEIDRIEQDILDKVREEVEPFEESRSELAKKIMEMDDESGRTILEEASQKMYALILEKTAEASNHFHEEKRDYYASLGPDAFHLLTHDKKYIENIAAIHSPIYGGSRAYE